MVILIMCDKQKVRAKLNIQTSWIKPNITIALKTYKAFKPLILWHVQYENLVASFLLHILNQNFGVSQIICYKGTVDCLLLKLIGIPANNMIFTGS
jgi:hypothetical protein